MAATNSRGVCLITGGSSGIGLATAHRFAAEGFQLAICGRDPARLNQAVAVLRSRQVLCEGFALDLEDARQAGRMVEQALQCFGRIDVLVNNAACAPRSPLEEMRDEDFEATINLNLRAVFYATRRAWQVMMEQKEGVIVNISSLAAVDPFAGFSAYGASKAWLELWTHALAAEGKPHGIRVFCIRAGIVETPLMRGLFPDMPAEQALAPDDVADTIWNVCQTEMRHCSGQSITVKR